MPIARLAPGARRDRLDAWLTGQLPARFETAIVPIDAETANGWGRIMARGQAAGRPIGTMDAFIAATAERHGLTLVTRNVRDFEGLGIGLVNPWHDG